MWLSVLLLPDHNTREPQHQLRKESNKSNTDELKNNKGYGTARARPPRNPPRILIQPSSKEVTPKRRFNGTSGFPPVFRFYINFPNVLRMIPLEGTSDNMIKGVIKVK